ncbi:segregation/condensation protein A [Deltaproteobacteria bacterium OttesenSCG-928-K17]|nr:segregation/condensation protein A [Deltaproteobacteria bacterium OttesenSCG-928-K17]
MSELLVKLQIYEGPLDLLLHLIKKNEVDLDDIPVALITAQYLEYLDLMESMNVELASDFLVMAATLTQIKSRLLLPREDDEGDDPANDLKAAIIDPLLERLRLGLDDYKEAAAALRHRQVLDSDVFVRGATETLEPEALEEALGDGLAEASLFDLVDVFRRLTEKKPEVRTLKFVVETKTIGERIEEIRSLLKARSSVSFEELCAEDKGRAELVLSFLAVLELARTGFLRLYQNLADSFDMGVFLANPEAELSGLDELTY